MISFLFPITACELKEDLIFYIKWAEVPSMFLNCQLRETRYRHYVCNPMIRYIPYHPRRYLDMRPNEVWGPTLPALGAMLSRDALREAKTYRRCALRWIWDCISNLEIYYWDVLCAKLFSRISLQHFHCRYGCSHFLEESLRQVDSYTHASVAE
jgi:hypothetical protein